MEAIWEALRAFTKVVRNRHIQVISDSVVVIPYINKLGGTRCPSLIFLTSIVLAWAEINLRSISAVDLKGWTIVWQTELPSGSRVRMVAESRCLSVITEKWGVPQVDSFTNKLNAKVPMYFSLERDNRAKGVDALAQTWEFRLCYAFPPFKLISLVLRNLVQDTTSDFSGAILAEEGLVFHFATSSGTTSPHAPPE